MERRRNQGGKVPCHLRRGMLAVALAALAAPARALTPLPRAQDLRAAAAQAAARGEALVLLFSLPDCPYCERVRKSTYQWLVKDGHAVQQVEMEAGFALVDFDGRPANGRALAQRYHVSLAPTALFVGPGGVELAERLTGAGQPDYYGAQVDAAMAQAAAKLRGSHA